jgi:hypothetical protein
MAKQSSGVRTRFVQDDSSHWYAIPADKKDAFDAWVLYMSDEGAVYVPYEGEEFDDFRIDGYPGFYTFTDLQEDK